MESKRGVKRPRSAEATEGESSAKVSKTENKASKEDSPAKVIVQFKSTEGEATGPQIEIAPDVTTEQLHDLINNLLKNEEKLPYSFFVNDDEIVTSLKELLDKQKASPEDIVPILYQPQAVFRVRAVTRCTATIPGHSAPVLHVSFSPDGSSLASGSGDATVRIWDVLTETPKHTLEGHASDVLAVAWAPNCKLLASGSKDGEVRVWDVSTGKRKTILKGHKKWVTSLAWEPYLSNPACTRLASASKDGTVRIWDIVRGVCLMTLSGHTASVTQVKWGGVNLLYSASQDRSIKVWETGQGKLVRTLEGHAHWVNSIALSTDYALRTGPYDEKGGCPKDEKEILKAAQDKYNKALEATARKGSEGKSVSGELLASGSEDFTLHLWDPTRDKKPVTRMTGHQQPINYICYSPDGRSIASASFDKSVRLWNGSTGRFITRFVAHVGAVYQLAWSADSRMLVSGSKDSTMKLWEIRTKKMAIDLPGHADEVYAVDWSPDGERVASGGKDKVLKIWRK